MLIAISYNLQSKNPNSFCVALCFASLTSCPDFAIEQTRGRNRINRLRPRLTMECYAVERNKALSMRLCTSAKRIGMVLYSYL